MKKMFGVLLTVVMMGALLSGCYQACQQPQPMNLKGEG